MALFTVDLKGFDDVSKRLMNGDKAATAAVPEMLKAGASVAQKYMTDEIKRTIKHASTGALEASIQPGKVKRTRTNASIDVYPKHEDKKGVSNALKGAILHRGRKANKNGRAIMLPTGWVTHAKDSSAKDIHDTMQGVWNRYNG